MTYTCPNCDNSFVIERHQALIIQSQRMLVCGTGKNMVYKGDMNREYAMCPGCGVVEDQWSAEARDQDPETSV